MAALPPSSAAVKWGQQPDLRCKNFDLDMSEVGHFRPRQRALPPGPLPLRPEKLTSSPNEKLFATGQLLTHALQAKTPVALRAPPS